ncbi:MULTISPECIES: conjugative transfer signal peptidase TraF [unclassified Nitratireductor]|uniref:conjugative transfer signal peptidase TraF n=1 Tax=unclassified Nitratireductor TaxID=2641084 RepID=UPI000D0CB2E1|nr:conjugative transfer signal peptidase TraF [Nitratireductor sp. StC3]PSM15886.1 conjugative transfer signal peptidase TraF [Nitratireductor sp. StC3]
MTRRRRALTVLWIGVAVVSGLFSLGYLGSLRFNLTSSYPLGIWRIAPLDREVAVGDLIMICPPPTPVFTLARQRGYLRSGLCSGWLSPMIKTVAATQGQRVEIAGSVSVDGVPLAGSELRAADGEGRALIPFAGGVVPPGRIFLHSDFAGSYDSRYFGPVPAAGVLGLAQPVLTIHP